MGYNQQFIKNVPLNADYDSLAQQLLDGAVYSIQLEFTGATCECTVSLLGSSDPYNNTVGYVPPNFDPIEDATQSITEAGSFTFNVGQVGYNWVQVNIVDNSSGSNDGTVSARINVKNGVA